MASFVLSGTLGLFTAWLGQDILIAVFTPCFIRQEIFSRGVVLIRAEVRAAR